MWYVDKDAMLMTPFGKMTLAPRTGEPPHHRPRHTTAAAHSHHCRSVLNLVKPIRLNSVSSPEPATRWSFPNGTPGVVAWNRQQIPGVAAKLDAALLPDGGQACSRYIAGPQVASGVIILRVKPIGPRISIKVSVE